MNRETERLPKGDHIMAIKVYIDQGHNPVNPNAGAEGNGLREQDLVFVIGRELADVLGIPFIERKDELTAEQQELFEARKAARKAKNWAESDRIRDELKAQGIIVEDTPQGMKWKRA